MPGGAFGSFFPAGARAQTEAGRPWRHLKLQGMLDNLELRLTQAHQDQLGCLEFLELGKMTARAQRCSRELGSPGVLLPVFARAPQRSFWRVVGDKVGWDSARPSSPPQKSNPQTNRVYASTNCTFCWLVRAESCVRSLRLSETGSLLCLPVQVSSLVRFCPPC